MWTCAIVAGMLVSLLWVTLFLMWQRKIYVRNVCLNCDYPVRSTTVVCPECGRPPATGRPLSATRWALLAVASLAPLFSLITFITLRSNCRELVLQFRRGVGIEFFLFLLIAFAAYAFLSPPMLLFGVVGRYRVSVAALYALTLLQVGTNILIAQLLYLSGLPV